MISLENLVIGAFTLLIFLVIIFCIVLYLTTSPYPKVWRHKSEKSYFNAITGKNEDWPTLDDEPRVSLSVIVPAYNEELRLPPMLDECLEFLDKRTETSGFTYEIIVVSDGSTDKTVEVAQSYAKKYNTVKVLELVKNRGKGGAVRLGVQSAQGKFLLFADADGATKFSDLVKLEASMTEIIGDDYLKSSKDLHHKHAIVCGSRAHLEKEETAKRSYFRLFLMHGFHFLVWSLCVREIRDTQCGFKLFTRHTAKILFNALHVERWAFDVELLYLAQTLNIPIAEVAVNWTEIEGSKIIPFWSWLQMGRDLVLIWLRYKIGAWKIEKSKSA